MPEGQSVPEDTDRYSYSAYRPYNRLSVPIQVLVMVGNLGALESSVPKVAWENAPISTSIVRGGHGRHLPRRRSQSSSE